MKIDRIEANKIRMPTKIKYAQAGGTYTSFVQSLLVRVYTDTGIVGVGDVHVSVLPGYTSETLDTMHAVVTNAYAPALLGMELECVERLHAKMIETRRGNAFARCGIEMALFDALARARKIGICEMLGGPVQRELALVGGIGIDAPEAMAAQAASMVAAGYRAIKMKVGTANIHDDLLRVRTVRAAIGDAVPIRVDANACYAPTNAMAMARGLADLGVEHFEQPVAAENIEAMARLTRSGTVPILADESVHTAVDALRVITAGAADAVKIKISKVGGFIEARKIIDVAEAAGMKTVIGNGMGSSIEAASELHLACAYPHVHPVAEMVGPAKIAGDLAEQPFDLAQGVIRLPEGDGLGVTLSEARAREYALD